MTGATAWSQPRPWRPQPRSCPEGLARWVALGAVLSAGCATLPDEPVQRALYSDVRQVVETRERIGWIVDRTEYEAAAPSLLQSVCQVSHEERIQLLDWLDERIAEEGGPAEEAYRREDEDLGAIDELLTLERMRGALEHADALTQDDCPFWMGNSTGADGTGQRIDGAVRIWSRRLWESSVLVESGARWPVARLVLICRYLSPTHTSIPSRPKGTATACVLSRWNNCWPAPTLFRCIAS